MHSNVAGRTTQRPGAGGFEPVGATPVPWCRSSPDAIAGPATSEQTRERTAQATPARAAVAVAEAGTTAGAPVRGSGAQRRRRARPVRARAGRPAEPKPGKSPAGWPASGSSGSALVGWPSLVLLGLVAFAVAYARTDIPDPNAGFEAADDLRLLRRRQDRARQVRRAGPHEHRRSPTWSPTTCRRGDRRRGPHLLHQPGHRPEGHPARRLQQRPGRRHPGRLDDHPAVRQGPLPDPGADLPRKVKEAILSLKIQRQMEQGRDPRGLPQHHLLRPRAPTASRPRPARTSASRRASSTVRQGAALAAIINSPNNYDPANGKAAKAALLQPLPLRHRRSWTTWARSTAGELARGSSGCRSSPRSRSRASYGGQRGHVLQMVRDELHGSASATPRSTAAASGSPRPSPEGDGRRRRQASAEQRPSLNELHVAVASVDPQTGALRGHVRRAGLPEEPASTGPSPAAHRARPSSRSRSPPALEQRLLARSRPSTAARRSRSPATEFSNQGEGGGDELRHRQPAHATENSVNTAYVDLADSHRRRRRQGHRHRGRRWASRATPRARPEPQHRARLGRRSARSTWPTPTAPSPTAGGQGVYVIERVKTTEGGSRGVQAQRARPTQAISEDVAADTSFALQQVARGRHRHQRQRASAAGRRQDRHRDRRRGPRPVVVVRRLHPQLVDRGDVQPRQRQRAARRLPRHVLRRRAPGPHLGRRHGAGPRGRGDRGRSRAGQPRARPRPTTRRRRRSRRSRPKSPSRPRRRAVERRRASRADADADPDRRPTPTDAADADAERADHADAPTADRRGRPGRRRTPAATVRPAAEAVGGAGDALAATASTGLPACDAGQRDRRPSRRGPAVARRPARRRRAVGRTPGRTRGGPRCGWCSRSAA